MKLQKWHFFLGYPVAFLSLLTLASLLSTCKTKTKSELRETRTRTEQPNPWEDTRYRDFGANADCSENNEKPMQLDEFRKLALDVPSTAEDPQQELLNLIESGKVPQTFTINFDSESAQSPGISSEYPGVIRMNQNGTLIVRYTCDRAKTETYGTFEIISFDLNANEFKFSSLDMRAKPAERVHSNPELCYGCHNYGND